jgi:DNA-binding transcriptional regulator YhcF (GntR family)
MEIALSKESNVPVQQQLAAQIVFLISTGKLRPAEQLPSVRSLARRLGIHHNTVSKACSDLVSRNWLKRRRGSRLCVAPAIYLKGRETNDSLDELIDRSTERARELGYSLATVRARVAQRLALQPPDHLLVVEQDLGLRRIMQAEIGLAIRKRVAGCTAEEFLKKPELAGRAQVLVPEHAFHWMPPVVSTDWPPIRLVYSNADQMMKLVRGLKQASTIAVVSVSESVIETARGLFASAITRRHSLLEVLVRSKRSVDLRGVDVVFCDTLTLGMVNSRKKVHYRLLTAKCMREIAATSALFRFRIGSAFVRSKI